MKQSDHREVGVGPTTRAVPTLEIKTDEHFIKFLIYFLLLVFCILNCSQEKTGVASHTCPESQARPFLPPLPRRLLVQHWRRPAGADLALLWLTATATAKSLQSCPTLCDPIASSPPGSSVHGILQARVLEWGAIAFSNTVTLALLKSFSPPKS